MIVEGYSIDEVFIFNVVLVVMLAVIAWRLLRRPIHRN